MQTAKKHATHAFSQFELSKLVLNNLKHFELTPVGKLVLLVLVDCYNADNGDVVFPSIEFIAEKIGCGLTATKQAISDLIKQGLIIKSKRSKIKGNYNKYLLTLKVRNLTSERSENECFNRSDSDCFHEEQKKRTNKTTNIVALNSNSDDKILREYAEKQGAKNVQAYINSLVKSGVAADIIRQYREKEGVQKYWDNQAAKTAELIKEYNSFESEPPTQSWEELRKTLFA